MKLTVLREELLDALEAASQGIALRTSLPICKSVKLVPNGTLSLTGTDLDVAVTAQVLADVEEPGPGVCAPGRLLLDFLRAIPEEDVRLETGDKPTVLEVTAGRYSARFYGAAVEDFPLVPEKAEAEEIKLEAGLLRDIAGRVVFASARDETRPVLQGVCISLSEGHLEAAAADGYRLAILTVPAEGLAMTGRAIVPARVFKALDRFARKVDGTVSVALSEGRLHVELPQIKVTASLIAGSYPPYRELVPGEWKTRVVVSRSDLSRIARVTEPFAESNIVRFWFRPGQVSFRAGSDDVGVASGEIDAQVEGEENRIALNARYLMDVLAAVGTEGVVLEMTSQASPMVFRGAGDESLLVVVMPMFVIWD